jgi:hypothetical protein
MSVEKNVGDRGAMAFTQIRLRDFRPSHSHERSHPFDAT